MMASARACGAAETTPMTIRIAKAPMNQTNAGTVFNFSITTYFHNHFWQPTTTTYPPRLVYVGFNRSPLRRYVGR